MKLTKIGQRLLAKCLTESFELKFVRFSIGDGLLDENEPIYELTDLKNWKMDIPIVDLKIVGNGTAEITGNLNNAEIEKGFCAREHGLFALDDAGEAVMFSYHNTGEFEYDFVPSFSGGALKNLLLTDVIEIQDAENITAVIDYSAAYITTLDFKAHVDSEHPHPNTPNYFGSVTNTDSIWTTDHDNNLYKISIDNLRELLKTKSENVKSDEEKIMSARDELGLNANLLMIEDFQGGDEVTDEFKSRVTSAAAGSRLIGIVDIKDLKTGAFYTISDGVNSEVVQIAGVRRNDSGYHAKLKKPLDYSYNYSNTFLYRSTRAGSDKKSVTWDGIYFNGVEANIARVLELENVFDVTGDGVVFDGFLTLG